VLSRPDGVFTAIFATHGPGPHDGHTGVELPLTAVRIDERRHVELCQLHLELADGSVVSRVFDRVAHQFDEQSNDHPVEAAGIEPGHPDERVTDLPVVGTVTTGDLVGKLLVAHREGVCGGELVESVLGLDDLLEAVDQRPGDEPGQRVGVCHDRVCLPAGTAVSPHPEVEVARVDPLTTGQL